MKTKLTLLLAIFTFLFIFNEGQALAITFDNEVNMELEEITMTAESRLIEDGISYLPVWTVAKAAGLGIEVEPGESSVKLKRANSWLVINRDSNEATTAEGTSLQGKLLVKNNNIYIPVVPAGEYFKFTIIFKEKLTRIKEFNEFPMERVTSSVTMASSPVKAASEKKAAKAKKVVYLTFDDGPTADTPKILEILKQKKARATFFMLEPQMRQYKDQVKRLVEEGHYPALHSVTHDKNKLYGGSPGNVAAEMEKTRQTLLKITGVDSRLTRVPYGSKPFMKDEFRNALVKGSFKMWDWNIDTQDWKYQQENPQQIYNEVAAGVKKLKGQEEPLVVLMHVNKGTASVLPKIIDFLQKQGYTCEAYNPDAHFTMNFWKDSRL
jgi:peptidoglycan-N-acetylglucosamine deacetylase